MTMKEARDCHMRQGGVMSRFFMNLDTDSLRAEVVGIRSSTDQEEIPCDLVVVAKSVSEAVCTAMIQVLEKRRGGK